MTIIFIKFKSIIYIYILFTFSLIFAIGQSLHVTLFNCFLNLYWYSILFSGYLNISVTPEPTCDSGKFRCDNGDCIDLDNVCNQSPDCDDESDEQHCSEYY